MPSPNSTVVVFDRPATATSGWPSRLKSATTYPSTVAASPVFWPLKPGLSITVRVNSSPASVAAGLRVGRQT